VTATYPGMAHPAGSLPGWHLLFAREPEPDLDFDDSAEPSDRGGGMDSGGGSDGPSKRRPLLLIVGVVVVAGALYFVWDSGMLSGLLGPSGDAAAPGPAEQSPPSPPPPQAAGEAQQQPSPATMPPPMSAAKSETKPPAPIMSSPPPAFSEGQHVSVVPDPTLPAAAVSLNADSNETKPGPLVSPTTVLIVMDGEFRNNGWIYTVRTPDGAVGWISERRLRAAKP